MRTIKKSTLLSKLGNFVSVKNTESRNGCGSAPNQFELIFENGKAFQSYETLIAVRYDREWYFSSMHSCSNTTSSHTTRWCGLNSRERNKGLENGAYILIED